MCFVSNGKCDAETVGEEEVHTDDGGDGDVNDKGDSAMLMSVCRMDSAAAILCTVL